MKRKRIISIIAIVLAFLMAFSMLASVLPAYAITQADINALKAKRDALAEESASAQERVDILKETQANVLDQKTALEDKNAKAKEALVLIAEEIAMYNEIVAEKTEELNAALNREHEQLQKYRVRVRAMEESGGYNILAFLLKSENFHEFLTALDDIESIMTSDRDLEDRYIEAREEAEAVKAEYEAVRAECEEKQRVLQEEQAAIEADIAETEAELAELEDQLAEAIEAYEAAQAAEAQAAQDVLNLIAAYDEQKRQEAAAAAAAAAAAGGGSSGGDSSGTSGGSGGTATAGLNPGAASGTGSFVWPVPCSTRVTSRFGYRTDPFTGESRYHSGIDIDGYGNDGNIIIAADGGTVVTSTYSDGYGNYVIIDHGNGYKTLYGHMSSAAVSSGQSVSQGQTIGYLGATGRATGTHCHFEIYINGERTDPAAYFSGLSYYNC